MLFRPGNELKTITPQKTIFARAKIKEQFESEFAIYNLAQFLNTLSLFKAPELNILESNMEIIEGKEKVKYVFADTSLISRPPEKDINFPDAELNFKLSTDNFTKLMKAAAVIGSPEIMITGDGSEITIGAGDTKNSSDNTYKLAVGDTDKKFNFIFSIDNFKMLPKDYDVSISSKKISRFESEDLVYYVATEQHSTYEE
jgi:hypothetical protein